MFAHRRRPTIRRVRDWEPNTAPDLRPARVPLDLLPPSSSSRDTLQTVPLALPILHDDDDDEMEKATLARYIPLKSDVHEILDPEQTLARIREVQASIADPDAALDSLVAVYEERVERLAKQRAHAAAIVAQACSAPESRATHPRPGAKGNRGKTKRTKKPLDRALVKLQPHLWKIVYSTICLWGLLQLALTR